MERYIYWIKELITNKKDCRGFCPMCEYYNNCKEDEATKMEYKKNEDTGIVEIIEDGKKIAEFIPIDVAKRQAVSSNVA